MSKIIQTERMEVLCTECGSVFWIDTEVVAVNNTPKLWCPYCKDDTGLTIQDLRVCRNKFKDKYDW